MIQVGSWCGITSAGDHGQRITNADLSLRVAKWTYRCTDSSWSYIQDRFSKCSGFWPLQSIVSVACRITVWRHELFSGAGCSWSVASQSRRAMRMKQKFTWLSLSRSGYFHIAQKNRQTCRTPRFWSIQVQKINLVAGTYGPGFQQGHPAKFRPLPHRLRQNSGAGSKTVSTTLAFILCFGEPWA